VLYDYHSFKCRVKRSSGLAPSVTRWSYLQARAGLPEIGCDVDTEMEARDGCGASCERIAEGWRDNGCPSGIFRLWGSGDLGALPVE